MKITNAMNLPQPFVDACRSDYQYKPKRYSVTALLRGATQNVLERRHSEEISVDASESVWAVFGSAVHTILENGQETQTQFKENKLEAKVEIESDIFTLSGIFDLYDMETGTVYEYKTCSCWKVAFDDWSDYRRQLLCYCWLLRQNGFKACNGVIVALIKDWNKRKSQTEQGYPPVPVHTVEFNFSDEDFQECDHWIHERFDALAIAERTPDFMLPACSDEERWYTGTRFAVMGKGKKRATRVFGTEEDAQEFIDSHPRKDLFIQYRPGENRRCMDYCNAAPFCAWWQEQIQNEI